MAELETKKTEQVASNHAESPDLTDRTLGDFQLLRKLGQGGMGQVYLARQLSLKRQVAVKILKPELAANNTALERFRREAEAVAGITHANIVQIYQIGEDDGLHYMALEYVEGRNLREFLHKKGSPDLPIALNIMRQMAAALQRAGEMGFVHRDIKPENILLTRKGEVKVTDFGLSRCFASQQPLNLTQSGVTMGTPLYMSPEQVQGKTVDPRSDIYSFGITCYQMLAGEPPFRGTTAFDVALQHVQSEAVPLMQKRPDLSVELCDLVHKMMAKNPDDRFQTAREVLREINRIRESLAAAQTGVVAVVSAMTGVVGAPEQADGSTLSKPVASATVEAGTGQRYWMLAVGISALGLLVGFTAHWSIDASPLPNSSPAILTDDGAENAHANFVAHEEQKLLAFIDDKTRKLEIVVDNVLDLLMLYIREKNWESAEDFLKNLPKRGAFQESNIKGDLKGAPRTMTRFYSTHLSALGKGIIQSHRDDPVGSNRSLLTALNARDNSPKKVEGAPTPIDFFFLSHANWKKEVADAIDRNQKNLQAIGKKLDDPVLEKYRSYWTKSSLPGPK